MFFALAGPALASEWKNIQALWDAAEVFTCNLDPVESMCAENGVSCNDCLMVELRRAVESLSDLLGGDHAEDS